MTNKRVSGLNSFLFAISILLILQCVSLAEDWRMFGRDQTRNSVSKETDPPIDWHIGEFQASTGDWVADQARNVKWVAKLGSITCGDPVVADGFVWVGTNNTFFNAKQDASVLACLRESDGKLMYKYVSPRLPNARSQDWVLSSMASSPLIDGDRLWFVTNRCETVCLDIGPLRRNEGEPSVVWKCDMIKQLGVHRTGAVMNVTRHSSVALHEDRIFVITGNGVDYESVFNRSGDGGPVVPAPEAPSLVCFDKDSGAILWQDNSPGANTLSGQWASPLVAQIKGRTQVITPQGDGWLRSFDAKSGELIWKFDMNEKTTTWDASGRGTRNTILATPVFYDNRIYLAAGQEEQNGEGSGRLCCIDPTKLGDISSQLAVDVDKNPLPPRRLQAVDPTKGEQAIPNPNSGLVWDYTKSDTNGDGEIDFEEGFHRTVSGVAVKDGLLMAADYSGLVHCFDSKTGKRHWAYDQWSACYTTPLIVSDKVFVANEDGKVAIFNLSRNPKTAMKEVGGELKPINSSASGDIPEIGSVHASPIYANGTLYIASRTHLFAIEKQLDDEAMTGHWPQWRGPNRDNVSEEVGLMQQWPEGGPPLKWRAEGLGQGIASVSIADGRIYTTTYKYGMEFVVAMDQRSGRLVWAVPVGGAVPESPHLRWLGQRTPTIDDDRVYVLTTEGNLVCLATNNGEERWKKNYISDFDGRRAYWGFCDYPLVDGDKLICTPGGTKSTVVALDKHTGKTLWKCGIAEGDEESRGNHSAIIAASFGGTRQYVRLVNGGLVGIAAGSGERLWQHGSFTGSAIGRTPLIRGDELLCAFRDRGVSLFGFAADQGSFEVKEVYSKSGIRLNHFQDNMIRVGDHVYVLSHSVMRCFEWRTGQQAWAKRIGSGYAATTYADGHIYVRSAGSRSRRPPTGTNARVRLISATPDKYVEKSSFEIPNAESAIGATTPVISGGHLYIRDNDRLFAYDVRQDSPTKSVRKATHIKLELPSEPSHVFAADDQRTKRRPGPRSVFVPTPPDVVERMLELARVTKDDVVYDLGSGDGRIVITAAKTYGCRAVGIEIDRELVEVSRAKAKQEGVADLVQFERRDIFDVDLSEASVIATYLLPGQLERLVPQFNKLKPGSRIVSHYFEIPGMKPDIRVTFHSEETGDEHEIYLWTTPLNTAK